MKPKKKDSVKKQKKDLEPPSKKQKKDPNAPKRNMSSFMFFSNDKRQQVKDENPSLAFGEVGKELGRLWKEASAEEKEVGFHLTK